MRERCKIPTVFVLMCLYSVCPDAYFVKRNVIGSDILSEAVVWIVYISDSQSQPDQVDSWADYEGQSNSFRPIGDRLIPKSILQSGIPSV